MFHIESVEIAGFWNRLNVACGFRPDVNIVIGRNGTGKTTFMNILHSVLTVDLEGLSNTSFHEATIKLTDGDRSRTVRAKRVDDERLSIPAFEYHISRKQYRVRLATSEDRRILGSQVRRARLETAEVRSALDELIHVSSVAVHRLRSDDDYEIRDRHGTRTVAPVDRRLSSLLRELTQYQLELSQRARQVAARLQKDVLASILYGREDATSWSWELDFDKEAEKRNLTAAYKQLSAYDADIRAKISFHVNTIDEAVRLLRAPNRSGSKEGQLKGPDFRSIEALRKTRAIIEKSLDAETETAQIFSQLTLFLTILESFATGKRFHFEGGHLSISSEHGTLEQENLSSGEKQLLILLIEALLQRGEPYIYLADEPELSLHIEWQRRIVPALLELNPQAQVVVATHSPEVASRFGNAIVDMERLVQ